MRPPSPNLPPESMPWARAQDAELLEMTNSIADLRSSRESDIRALTALFRQNSSNLNSLVTSTIVTTTVPDFTFNYPGAGPGQPWVMTTSPRVFVNPPSPGSRSVVVTVNADIFINSPDAFSFPSRFKVRVNGLVRSTIASSGVELEGTIWPRSGRATADIPEGLPVAIDFGIDYFSEVSAQITFRNVVITSSFRGKID